MAGKEFCNFLPWPALSHFISYSFKSKLKASPCLTETPVPVSFYESLSRQMPQYPCLVLGSSVVGKLIGGTPLVLTIETFLYHALEVWAWAYDKFQTFGQHHSEVWMMHRGRKNWKNVYDNMEASRIQQRFLEVSMQFWVTSGSGIWEDNPPNYIFIFIWLCFLLSTISWFPFGFCIGSSSLWMILWVTWYSSK